MVKGHCIRCGKLNIDDDRSMCFMCTECQEEVRRNMEDLDDRADETE